MNDFRYETKYTLNDFQLNKFKKKVFNQFHFKQKYPDRKISTIYLDDAYLTDAKENIIGWSKRKKIGIVCNNNLVPGLTWYLSSISPVKLIIKP